MNRVLEKPAFQTVQHPKWPLPSCIRQQVLREPILHVNPDTAAGVPQLSCDHHGGLRVCNEEVGAGQLSCASESRHGVPELPPIFDPHKAEEEVPDFGPKPVAKPSNPIFWRRGCQIDNWDIRERDPGHQMLVACFERLVEPSPQDLHPEPSGSKRTGFLEYAGIVAEVVAGENANRSEERRVGKE